MPDTPSAEVPDLYSDAYEAGTRIRPEHLVDVIVHEAMLHIRMQGFRLQSVHQQYGYALPPRSCRRRWRNRKPAPALPPDAHMAPVWMVADLLHNSVGYLTDRTSPWYGIEPGIEALIMMLERIHEAPRSLDEQHLHAFLDRALRGTGWTLTEARAYATERALGAQGPNRIAT